jgi:hypothetical protein
VREKHDEKLKQCDKVLRKVNGIWGMKRHKSEIREKIYFLRKRRNRRRDIEIV